MIITVLVVCIVLSANYFSIGHIIDPAYYRKGKVIISLWFFADYFTTSYTQKLDQIILEIRDKFIDDLYKAILGCSNSYILFDLPQYYLSICFCFTLLWIKYFYNPQQYRNLSFSLGVVNILISIYVRNSLSSYQSAFVFIIVSLFSLWTIWRSSISWQTFIYILMFFLDIMIEVIAFCSDKLNRVEFLINIISLIINFSEIFVILIFFFICFCVHLDSSDKYIKLLDKKKEKKFYFMMTEIYIFVFGSNLEVILVAKFWSNFWIINEFVWIFMSAILASFIAFPDDNNRRFRIFASNFIGTYSQVYVIKALWNLI